MDRRVTGLVAIASAAVAVALLHRPVASFGSGLWGPENLWTHRDFLGAWWLFWSAGRPGDELAMLAWPDGALPIQHHIPNPFDAWLLGPLVARLPFPAWWNGMQLGHFALDVAATAVLARAAGARGLSAFVAATVVACSPVMLHEIAGGRTLSGAAWPGLFALALLLRGRGVLAGVALAAQGLCYLYTGGIFLLAALVLRPREALRRALPVVAVVWLGYLAWLWPVFRGLSGQPPPAGHTALPLAGLLGLGLLPERFAVHPLLLAGFAAALAERRWRWAGVAALAGLVALGPAPTWDLGAPLFVSPLAWLQALGPGLARLHHPVRAVYLLLPALAVPLALALDRPPRWALALPALLALAFQPRLERACAWGVEPRPPGWEAAAWLATHGRAVVDLTGDHGAALGLQPVHGLPMLESLRRERPSQGRRAGALRERVDGWLAGERQPGLARALAEAGFSHLLVVERGQPVDTRALEADLGPPVTAGVYLLDRAQ